MSDLLEDQETSKDIADLFVSSEDLVNFIDTVETTKTPSHDAITDNPVEFVAKQRAEHLEKLVKKIANTEDDEKVSVTEIEKLTENGASIEKSELVSLV